MSGERILVVDDSAEVRDFLASTVLGLEGYEIETARNGQEGLQTALASPPDLIITDQAMPNLTGLEMIAALREQGLDTPVILMTAEGSEEIAAQSFHVGVRYYFIKPFDPAELQQAIDAIFQTTREEEPPIWGGDSALRVLGKLDDAVLVVDVRGTLRYANGAAAPFISNGSPENAIGKMLSSAIKDRNLISLLSGKEQADESEMPTDDGRAFNVRIQVIEGAGRVAILRDITRQKALDDKRSEFVSTVAHDLRSPLTAILSYLELMTRVGALTPQQVTFTNQMRQGVERMTALLNDLLELSKIESGQEQHEQVSLWEVARSAVEDVKLNAETKSQKLLIEGASDRLIVEGNPRRLNQVFTNLLENAIKYTPQGGTIRINLAHMAGQAMASVTDTGIGIAQKDIPHVFDRFYRVDEVSAEYEGTGLGLSIVKTIVETHNGRVWVESAPGKGSVFTIVLPALAA